MRHPADKAAFLEPADETVDARFRLQVQRVLHLVKGWRHAPVVLQPLVDKQQQFPLLRGKH
jgi:hypothetical protein